MKVKCIGGECDGQTINLNETFFTGHHIAIDKKFKLTGYLNSDPTTENLTTYILYRIAEFHFTKNDTYKFLVPYSWSDKEAILFQFSK